MLLALSRKADQEAVWPNIVLLYLLLLADLSEGTWNTFEEKTLLLFISKRPSLWDSHGEKEIHGI